VLESVRTVSLNQPDGSGRLLPRVSGLAYGGDYNPEQWPEHVWAEDVALMREAGVTLITLGVFSWAWLEQTEGVYTFDRMDRVIEGLHAAGIAVDLATPTASPPPWFSHAYPESQPVDRDGHRLTYGSRQAICPSSATYRQAALRIAEQLGRRYGGHPAVAMWHVHNEYACHNAHCYCDASAEAFRTWLRRRYDGIDALNEAWGTAFWSQTYTDWAQVQPPRATPTSSNPGQVLDWRRFSSDEHLAGFIEQRDLLHQLSPGVPVTTNLMPGSDMLDHWAWAAEMTGSHRVVSSDHYLIGDEPRHPAAQIAYAADLSRSLAGGSWLLMEHSTSAVNWQPRNIAKLPGQLRRDSLNHVARGSEGAMFFQWRASRAGSEKWHSAMLPHAGTESKIWREVVQLGADLRALAEVDGARTDAPVAVLLDFSSAWAQEAANQPSTDMTAFAEIGRWHAALWRAGLTADLAPPTGDLSGYRVVVAPSLYLVDEAGAANLRRYVDGGGTLVVGPYSGLVDQHDRLWPAPLPGALADLLGVRVEEFYPLRAGESVELDDGSTGQVWTEAIHAVDADVIRRYADGPLAGGAAVTRRDGRIWYASTRLADEPLRELLAGIADQAGARPAVDAPDGIEAVRRRHPDGRSYLFLFNHGTGPSRVDARGTDLLTGTVWSDPVQVPAGAAVVLREERAGH
jgi:beta-galactosidase